jgi:hypothetical protein
MRVHICTHHAERDAYGGILKFLPAMHLRRFFGLSPPPAAAAPTVPENNSGEFSRDREFRKPFRANQLRQALPADVRRGRKKIAPGYLTDILSYG